MQSVKYHGFLTELASSQTPGTPNMPDNIASLPEETCSHLSVTTYSPATLALSILATVAGISLFIRPSVSTTPP